MHPGGVQRVVAVRDPQEARALLEGLRAEPGDVLELLAGAERAVGVPVRDDVVRERAGDAGDPGQQRRGGGVDVHTDRVDAVLDHGVQRARELHLAQVVLVLADADRLGVDLDQLGQRVLEPAGDRHRAADRHIEVRQLLRGERGGRVHRGAGLADHRLGHAQLRVPLEEVLGELVGLPRGGAVADRDQVHAVLLRQRRQRRQRGVPLVGRLVRVDRVVAEHLAGGVHHGDLHAGPEARVQAHGGAGAGRGGQQQVPQVRGEHPDRLVLGLGAQPAAQVDAEPDQHPGAPGPADGVAEPLVGRAAVVGDAEAGGDPLLVVARAGQVAALVAVVRGQVEVQHLLLLAAQHRQDPVRGELGVRLGEVEVVGELRALLLLALADGGDQPAPAPHPLAQRAHQVGVLAEPLDQDRPGALQRGGAVRDGLVEVPRGQRRRVLRRVGEQGVRQRLQTGLAGDLGLGAPLRLEREVDVLQPRLGVGGEDPCPQLVVQLALRLDRLQDGGAALLQLPQVAQPLLQGAQLRVVQRAGDLLAVTGHERHRRTAVQQLDRRLHLPLADAQFLGDLPPDRLLGLLGRLFDWRGHEAGHLLQSCCPYPRILTAATDGPPRPHHPGRGAPAVPAGRRPPARARPRPAPHDRSAPTRRALRDRSATAPTGPDRRLPAAPAPPRAPPTKPNAPVKSSRSHPGVRNPPDRGARPGVQCRACAQPPGRPTACTTTTSCTTVFTTKNPSSTPAW